MKTQDLNHSTHERPCVLTAGGLAPGYSLGECLPRWAEIPVGLPVVLFGRDLPQIVGRVDCLTEDGSVIWVRDETNARRLIHREDGYTAWVVNRWPSAPGHDAS